MSMALQQRDESQQNYTASSPSDCDVLHEGDGRLPLWAWILFCTIISAALLLAPFQMLWPKV